MQHRRACVARSLLRVSILDQVWVKLFFSLVSNFFVVFKIVVNVELTHDSILRVRKLFMAVSLNVRVAFNSFLRKIIFITMTNKAEPPYSVRVLSNYLKNTMKKVTPLMMAGVPQDFILLWNIGHDGVVGVRDLLSGVELLTTLDDLTVVIQRRQP